MKGTHYGLGLENYSPEHAQFGLQCSCFTPVVFRIRVMVRVGSRLRVRVRIRVRSIVRGRGRGRVGSGAESRSGSQLGSELLDRRGGGMGM